MQRRQRTVSLRAQTCCHCQPMHWRRRCRYWADKDDDSHTDGVARRRAVGAVVRVLLSTKTKTTSVCQRTVCVLVVDDVESHLDGAAPDIRHVNAARQRGKHRAGAASVAIAVQRRRKYRNIRCRSQCVRATSQKRRRDRTNNGTACAVDRVVAKVGLNVASEDHACLNSKEDDCSHACASQQSSSKETLLIEVAVVVLANSE